MDDSGRMRLGESVGDLEPDGDGFPERHRSAFQDRSAASPVDRLHRNAKGSVPACPTS